MISQDIIGNLNHKKMVRNIIFRNIPVSISGSVLSYGIMTIERESPPIFYSIFVFFSILFVYSFQRWYKSMSPFFAGSSRLIRPLHILILFLLFLIVLLFSGLDYRIIVILFFCLWISFWYVVPLFNLKLREIPMVKAPLVAITWSIILVYVPLYFCKSDMSMLLTGLFCIYFFALAIPFDIKDLDKDPRKQFSIPQVFGVFGTKLISVCSMGLFYFLFADVFPSLLNQPPYWLSLVFFAVVIVLVKKESPFLIYMLIDTSMILLGGSLLIEFQTFQP